MARGGFTGLTREKHRKDENVYARSESLCHHAHNKTSTIHTLSLVDLLYEGFFGIFGKSIKAINQTHLITGAYTLDTVKDDRSSQPNIPECEFIASIAC
jgi:hypothetical protein